MSTGRLRIIPLTIVIAAVFLMIKTVELIQGGQKFSESVLVSRVQAEEKAQEKPTEKATEKSKDTPKEETKKEDHAAPAEGEHGEEKPENANVSTSPGTVVERRFSDVEIELLQKLSIRREELDTWEKNLQIKEETLSTTEKRIDNKISQIESMKKEVGVLLAQYNSIEDAKIGSLVKIYENMKPVEAARIFDEMEMPILLLIIDRMKEKKSAPILANMDTRKAKQVTVDLAEQRRIASNRMKQAESAMQSGAPDDTAK